MDYLTEKWKVWYNSLDVNHDGTISFADVEESRNKFTNLHELIGDKATGVKVDMEAWWKTYILNAGSGDEVSKDEFITYLSNNYNKDKAEFVKKMGDCFNEIFDVIDTNKDRTIELNEFIYAFKAFGHENENLVRKAFALFEADFVPLKDIVSAWVHFVSEDDKSKKDIIKEAFDSGM